MRYLMIFILSCLIVFSGCAKANQKNDNIEKTDQVEDNVDKIEPEEENKENQEEQKNGFDDQEKPKVYENDSYRNVTLTGNKGDYIVTGEARVFEGVFLYRVSDNQSYLIEDHVQLTKGAPSWSPFKLNISLSDKELPENETITLELYQNSPKDGSVIHQLLIPIPLFEQ
ncbi:Gmad2 immunoglobulin-like domain-containing protein [Rossellomorea sp. BNER]|uniref:Gmad2 immunoglobulin-like domain-containing protein n=1 Tax=Rossellomorea sp. BNER TaxID=2962031 RepID=UPI003AF2CCD2|nr:Gmad2 immunoglobulin-like domain-containing protein [Rossellomorea sp. BNER]